MPSGQSCGRYDTHGPVTLELDEGSMDEEAVCCDDAAIDIEAKR